MAAIILVGQFCSPMCKANSCSAFPSVESASAMNPFFCNSGHLGEQKGEFPKRAWWVPGQTKKSRHHPALSWLIDVLVSRNWLSTGAKCKNRPHFFFEKLVRRIRLPETQNMSERSEALKEQDYDSVFSAEALGFFLAGFSGTSGSDFLWFAFHLWLATV